MASLRRIEKLNILLQEEVAKILEEEVEFPEGNLVTVTRASISDDVYYGTVFISILGKNSQKFLEKLEKNTRHIQQLLNRRLRIRPVPKIRFAIDEGELKREIVEKSLAELKRKNDF